MSQELQFVLTPRERPHKTSRKRMEQMHELWLRLAKRPWTSLAVIPVDSQSSTQDLAFSLADAGTELSDLPVSAITTNALDAGAARALAALAQRVNERQRRLPESPDASGGRGEHFTGLHHLPKGKLIVSVPAVTGEPVTLAVAHTVDLVVLAIQVGKTKVRDIKRTIEQIGKDRIAGCILY
jgi:hypothetical protein